MTDTIIVKVIALVGLKKLEDKYVEIPKELYDKALKEKKKHYSLDNYARSYRDGSLPEYCYLKEYIMKKIGYKIDVEIERINIVK